MEDHVDLSMWCPAVLGEAARTNGDMKVDVIDAVSGRVHHSELVSSFFDALAVTHGDAVPKSEQSFSKTKPQADQQMDYTRMTQAGNMLTGGFGDHARLHLGKGSQYHKLPLYKVKNLAAQESLVSLFSDQFVQLFQSLPFPQYTCVKRVQNLNLTLSETNTLAQGISASAKINGSSLAGILNLTSKLPDAVVRPDCGPRLDIGTGEELATDRRHHIAMLNGGTGGTSSVDSPAVDPNDPLCQQSQQRAVSNAEFGSVNLHCEMVDILVALVYCKPPRMTDDPDAPAEPQPEDRAGCVWYIYPRKDTDTVCEFLKKVLKERKGRGFHCHPLIEQALFLNAALRERLWRATGVRPLVVHQKLGEVVLVPTGCAFQIRNTQCCIRVNLNFLTPESAGAALGLAAEARKLRKGNPYREDKVNVRNLILHAAQDAVHALGVGGKYGVLLPSEEGGGKKKGQ